MFLSLITLSTASEALSLSHPLIRSRSLRDASPASKCKAVALDEELLPARPRPQTSMVLARRLLSGALGMKVTLTREQREKEANAIKAAKSKSVVVFEKSCVMKLGMRFACNKLHAAEGLPVQDDVFGLSLSPCKNTVIINEVFLSFKQLDVNRETSVYTYMREIART